MTAGEAIEKLRAQSEHPDTDCVAFVDEVVPALLRIAEAMVSVRGVLALSGSVGHMMLVSEIDVALAALAEAPVIS